MVSGDSADVWARQDEFRLDASVGVPPDAFSDTGQDWSLPVYRWDVLADRDFDWLRDARAPQRRLVRRLSRRSSGGLLSNLLPSSRRRRGAVHPARPGGADASSANGCSQVFREPGAEIIAEDLGIVPDFVRESLARLSIPGYKVLRWERHWHVEGQPFMDPADYPAAVCRHVGDARHRTDGDLVGGRAGRGEGGGARHSLGSGAPGRRGSVARARDARTARTRYATR